MFGIGNTIGAGIFALIGLGSKYAGPSLFLSFLFCGLVSSTTALIYSELSAKMPSSGSSYSYVYSTFGELPGWIVGWNLNLRYGITAGALSRAWTSYFVGLLGAIGITLPKVLYSIQIYKFDASIMSVLFIIICTIIMNMGAQSSNIFNYSITVGKLVTIVLIVIVGLTYFDINNFEPFIIEESGGILGTIQGGALTFLAYLGFDFITTLSQEAKNPKKDLPRSILLTVGICTFIYCIMSFSLAGVARLDKLQADTAIALAFEIVGNKWMVFIIYFSAFFGLTAATFAPLMSQPRILKAYADDGLFFKIFSKINPKTQVPTEGSVYICIFVCLVCFFFSLEEMSKTISLSILLSYSVTNAACIAQRFREETTKVSKYEVYIWSFFVLALAFSFSVSLSWSIYITTSLGSLTLILMIQLMLIPQISIPKETFRCPFVPTIPCIGMIGNFMLCCQMDYMTWVYYFIFNAIGICFYVGYGYRNSKLNRSQIGQNSKSINY
ncbi:amino acid transporter [Stylonychia lemnae]|uniref:Amino acid transporter n=1 Tax=Stylonychia lemnae TaxID=5949 RepID=A0A077ZVL8_STYLE|nr:amino acid transporter [Stylonychia lemnae]|eukprot:CDW73914.1 amino acid transporter [Stylonychia lemnae]